MIEAWLVLPALGLAFLLDGPGRLARRVRQVVVAGIVAGIVSLAWMTAVSLVPAAHRPYADGSSNPRIQWIAANCQQLRAKTSYYCTPADAG